MVVSGDAVHSKALKQMGSKKLTSITITSIKSFLNICDGNRSQFYRKIFPPTSYDPSETISVER